MLTLPPLIILQFLTNQPQATVYVMADKKRKQDER